MFIQRHKNWDHLEKTFCPHCQKETWHLLIAKAYRCVGDEPEKMESGCGKENKINPENRHYE
jgi:hypothetical protein